jgi:hypothetical protein
LQRFGVKLIVALTEPEALLGGFVGHAPEPEIERGAPGVRGNAGSGQRCFARGTSLQARADAGEGGKIDEARQGAARALGGQAEGAHASASTKRAESPASLAMMLSQ